VAVKIKLKRLGKMHAPQYRIVVADARTKRDGRAIEEIGKYHPMEDPSFIEVNSERAQYWLGVGAQPTEPVLAILKITGDWQKYKGLPGTEGTLRMAAPKADKKAVFEAAAKAAASDPVAEAVTPKAKAPKEPRKEAPKEAKEDVAPAEQPAAVEAPVQAPVEVPAETIEATEVVETVAETPAESTEQA
jgi:small subunit ribosomal protein S16